MTHHPRTKTVASMMLKLLYYLSIFSVYVCHDIKQPHIVCIVGDDIGWDDVSLHGSNLIMTPNIDMIGYQGIVLQNYYTDTYGTASRSAMFTGKYPFRMGTQGVSIGAAEDRGVPVSERLLPSYLKELGYATHLVGKWELGQSRNSFLPTYRGFESFYGFLSGSVDYNTYNHTERCNGSLFFGLDLFNNSEPVMNKSGHLTEVLTDQAVNIIKQHNKSVPLYLHVAHAAAHTGGGLVDLQAPVCLPAANIAQSSRNSDSVTSLDDSLGVLVSALAETRILNNTLIIFVSDNGAASAVGPNQNFGSNLPLRGTKGSPWEGAVRSTAVLWHNNIKPHIWKGLFHVTDWMPTLISAAGGNISKPIDGIDQWNAMADDEKPPRSEAVIAIDDLNEWGALRYGDFKLVVGNVDQYCSDYYGEELNNLTYEEPLYEKALLDSKTAIVFSEVLKINLNMSNAFEKRKLCSLQEHRAEGNKTQLCIPTKVKGCLFNITADPRETEDLWYNKTEVAKVLDLHYRLLWLQIKPRRPPSLDLRADPSVHGNIWYPWLDSDEPFPEPLTNVLPYPPVESIEELQSFVDRSNLRDLKLDAYAKKIFQTFVKYLTSLI